MFAVVLIHILCIYLPREDKCYHVVVDKNTLFASVSSFQKIIQDQKVSSSKYSANFWQHPGYTWNINKKTTRKKLMSVTHVKRHLRQVVTFYVLPNFRIGNTWYWWKEMVIYDVTFYLHLRSIVPYIFYDTYLENFTYSFVEFLFHKKSNRFDEDRWEINSNRYWNFLYLAMKLYFWLQNTYHTPTLIWL